MTVFDQPVITSISTRLITRALLRPWGADVPELHAIVVEVTAGSHTGQGFSWTPTIGPRAVQALLDHDITAFVLGKGANSLYTNQAKNFARSPFLLAVRGFRMRAASAGLSESALKAERITEIAMVTANC